MPSFFRSNLVLIFFVPYPLKPASQEGSERVVGVVLYTVKILRLASQDRPPRSPALHQLTSFSLFVTSRKQEESTSGAYLFIVIEESDSLYML